ncbi:uncharacterized protein ARMOST_11537 [Armillaria ostoyae]|uniref:Uncharacterized protein n=1 Tax=Armillaria ostoyae TaxID=47428 RepID=A0A284RHD9_ARMOS|nr:uncharacterized protein ARMOST_11537 [Armillaria ostoyae]
MKILSPQTVTPSMIRQRHPSNSDNRHAQGLEYAWFVNVLRKVRQIQVFHPPSLRPVFQARSQTTLTLST